MSPSKIRRTLTTLGAVLTAGSALLATPAAASHSWSGYHWAQASPASESAPASILLGNNLLATDSTDWPAIFSGTASRSVVHDWSNLDDYNGIGQQWLINGAAYPDILDTPWQPGRNLTSQKRCKPYAGQVEVCNARYGRTGWLGIAQVSVSGGHIVQGTAKVNDTYLDSSTYAAGRQHVLCQEVAHAFGLGHQSEEPKDDRETCMDYSRPLENSHPNAHDNEQIHSLYASHGHSSTTSASTGTEGRGASTVQRLEKDLYVRKFVNGVRIFTHVTWVDDRAAADAPSDRAPE